jgi:hypothetical protein
MSAKSQAQIPAILRSCDFTRFDRFGDIGGGNGHLLTAVLDRSPAASGVVFDLPHVVDALPPSSSKRIEFQAGDFFTDPLPACDAYLVMHVLHDWNDDRAVEILRGIRRSAPPHAVLLVLESIVPDDVAPTWERILDLHMLTIHEGRERTAPEFEGLLSRAGFCLERTIDTHAGVWILEARLSQDGDA